ncbi:MAG TPA: ECF-type sigma factor [Wenzhouxiangella sp.]|nr:ECF-type sigma factor [Wenzhouxiangella sp.]
MDDQPITRLLAAAAEGEFQADDRLINAVVGRLEQIAAREMAAGNRGGLDGLTLEPRMLAHDALLKILDRPVEFENRRHFFGYATRVMARALIDYQRRRNAQKRGGPHMNVTLAEIAEDEVFDGDDVPAALEELEALDPRKAELVGLRVFWGASMAEIADLLEISASTAERDWRFARRWLAARLNEGHSAGN